MRVGLLIYGDLHTISGGYLYDRKLVHYLRSQGDDVEIISLPWRNYISHLGDNLSPNFFRHLLHLNIDVLLQDELNHPSLFLLNWRLRSKVDYPIVSIVHHLRSSESHPAWLRQIYLLVERRYLASVNGFICNSLTTCAVVKKLLKGGEAAVVAQPGGDQLSPHISQSEVEARVERNGPLRVLFLGNVIRRKGLHVLIEALAKLSRDSCRLYVVGDENFEIAYAEKIRRKVAKHDLGHQVEFLGVLQDKALSDKMQACDVLAVPSFYEGFGISYIEGMGFGLPAIGSTRGAAHEVITDGENGFLINPGDVDAVASCLRELQNDRLLLKRLSLAALKRYEAHPTWEASGERIRSFLLEL